MIHQLCNVLTEPNYTAAFARADELDAHPAAYGAIDPLHGLPITVKDHLNVRGLDTTITYTSFCSQPATSQSALIAVLESLGAIAIAKNYRAAEHSVVRDRVATLRRIPGIEISCPEAQAGAKLYYLRWVARWAGVPGSVRIPSAMMGIAGFKPSTARLPYAGTAVSTGHGEDGGCADHGDEGGVGG